MNASSRVADLLESYPWLYGVGAGVAAYVAEYVALALIFLPAGDPSVHPGKATAVAARIGQVLHNAHFVKTRTGYHNADVVKYGNVLVGAEDPTIPVVVYFLVPVVALVAAGAVMGHRRYLEPSFSLPKVAADQAGEIALGYAGAGLVGAYLFVSVGQAPAKNQAGNVVMAAVTRHPDRLISLIMFVLYPVVLGWIGAMAAMYRRRRATADEAD